MRKVTVREAMHASSGTVRMAGFVDAGEFLFLGVHVWSVADLEIYWDDLTFVHNFGLTVMVAGRDWILYSCHS